MTQTIITGGMANGKSFRLEQEKSALSRIATKQYERSQYLDFGNRVDHYYQECQKVFHRSPTYLFVTLKQFESLKLGFNRLNISMLNPNIVYWGDNTQVVINNAIDEPYFLVKFTKPKTDELIVAKIGILSDMLDLGK